MPTKPKKSWPPEDGDITHLIERLDALEDRENVRFEALYARFYTGSDGCPWLRVCGEIHARDGLNVAHQLKVAVTVYDPKGRILNTGMSWVAGPDKFYGFEAFVIGLNTIGPIAKIRLYPQRA
jgi:hypothetical protein